MAKEVEIKLDLQATDVGAVNELLSGQPERTPNARLYDTATQRCRWGFSSGSTAGNRAGRRSSREGPEPRCCSHAGNGNARGDAR